MEIISGNYNNGLINELIENNSYLQEIPNVSNDKIYNYQSVVQLKVPGY